MSRRKFRHPPVTEFFFAWSSLAWSDAMVGVDLYQQAVDFYSDFCLRSPRAWFFEAWHDHYAWRGRAILRPLNLWGDFYMARGKGHAKSTSGTAAKWNTTFVDIPLAGSTWDDIADEWKGADAVFGAASGLLEDGYRLGFSYSGQNDAFTCSVTCKDEASPNFGKTFTAFAGSWYEALQTALYKHYVVAQANWGGESVTGNKPSFG